MGYVAGLWCEVKHCFVKLSSLSFHGKGWRQVESGVARQMLNRAPVGSSWQSTEPVSDTQA